MASKNENLLHEFFKSITFKLVLKIVGIGILLVVFLSVSLVFIKSILLSGFFGTSSETIDYSFYRAPSKSIESLGGLGSINVIEEKTYTIHFKTYDKKKIVDDIKSREDLDNIIIESFSEGEGYASFTIKVKRSYERQFLDFLKSYDPDSISTNTRKVTHQYTEVERKLKSLESQLSKIEKTINETEVSYYEIIRLAKNNYDLTNLREAIKDKHEILINLYSDKQEILDEIESLKSQLKTYEDKEDYVIFNVYITEEKLIDWSNYKEEWRLSVKNLFDTVNRVINSLTIGLLRTILEAIRIIVYTILVSIMVLFTGRVVWKFTKKILLGRK